MKIKILDSHRYLSSGDYQSLTDFFCKVKDIPLEEAQKQADFCSWYEREYAVSRFEVLAIDRKKIVGYLRCLRDPVDATRWLIGDVHVAADHQKRGIATRLYEKAIECTKEYEQAQQIVTSVHKENTASLALHEKLGFQNTGIPCDFPNLSFAPEESMHTLWLFREYPVYEKTQVYEMLLPLWLSCANRYPDQKRRFTKKALKDLLSACFDREAYDLNTIWCGNRLVGFTYYNNEEEFYYNELEEEV